MCYILLASRKLIDVPPVYSVFSIYSYPTQSKKTVAAKAGLVKATYFWKEAKNKHNKETERIKKKLYSKSDSSVKLQCNEIDE